MSEYFIQLKGQVDVNELNQLSPHQMTAIQEMDTIQVGTSTTCFRIHTDQSGLIGMLRYLHNHGLVLMAIVSEATE